MAQVNGRRLLSATVHEIAVGAWHADVEWDPDGDTEPLTGISFEIEGIVWKGTAVRSGLHGGRGSARVVGGAGGLSTELPARDYYSGAGVPVSSILGDIARESGETVSATSDGGVTGTRLPKWHRTQAPASHALVSLLDELGASWRVLRDGTIWVGPIAFPNAATFDHVLIDEDWAAGVITIAAETPTLAPATTFRGQRLEQVVHRLSAGKLRSEGRLTAAGSSLRAFLGHIRRAIDYSRPYPARVAAQNADETLQVVPDDASVRGKGLDRVKIRRGLPGITKIEVPEGARCTLEFEAGDPGRPIVTAFEPGAVTFVEFDGGTKSVARVGDLARLHLHLQFIPGTGGASATLFVKTPESLAWTAVGVSPVPPAPFDGGTPAEARITTGNDKLKA